MVLAPTLATLSDSFKDSLLVNVEAPEVGPSIEMFEANVKDGTAEQRCTIKPTMKPLLCQIPHLTENTTYVVEVKSRMPDK